MTEHAVKSLLWTAEDAAAATSGRHGPGNSHAGWKATGVSIDSRTVVPGDLFIAIKGPNNDGHDHVAKAFAAGAVAAVVSVPPAGVAADAPLLVVEDTFQALQDLGRVARLRSRATVIGVTGSVGKTGTKEMLRTCLAAQATTYATEGSLNNHWGVPLSLARLPADAAFGVFELGMNHAGELGPLSRLVQPDVAIITTIEPAHIEFFTSVEAIADAKAEIFAGMAPSGIAVLNRDNPHFGRLLAAARTQGLSRIATFGTHAEAEARLVDCALHATCSTVTADIRSERLQYCLSLPGIHWAMNSLAVLLAVLKAGGDPVAAGRAMALIKPPKGRGVRRRVQFDKGSFTIIDESYNASPVSMAAAFAVLGRVDPGAGGRRIAVLGDMRELGCQADAFHEELAGPLQRHGIDLVFGCGPHMRRLLAKLPARLRGAHAETAAELAAIVGDAVRGGDVVMVKGSAGSRTALVVDALTALDRTPGVSTDSTPAAVAAGQT